MFSLDRNAHTKVAVEWYRKLNQYAIPHLVCLTHGDRLYAECADEEQSERDMAYTKKAIKKQVEVYMYIFHTHCHFSPLHPPDHPEGFNIEKPNLTFTLLYVHFLNRSFRRRL